MIFTYCREGIWKGWLVRERKVEEREEVEEVEEVEEEIQSSRLGERNS
jgi:hypothetical protein